MVWFVGALNAATLGMISLSRATDTPSTLTAGPPAAMSPPPIREQFLIPRPVQNSSSALGTLLSCSKLTMCSVDSTTYSAVIDLPVSLVTLPLGHFLFPHHPPGTHCLYTSALLTNYQPSNVN